MKQSVNESNAYQRGKRDGYDIGHTAGTTETYKQATEVRWMKLAIAGLVGFMLAVTVSAGAQSTHAQSTAQTTLTVTIGAEVPCNPENCKEIPEEEPAQVQNVEHSESLLQRMWSAILRLIN